MHWGISACHLLNLPLHRMVPFTNHFDHLQIDRTKSHQLNQDILSLLKRLLRW